MTRIALMRLLDTMRRWHARRTTIRQLSQLDDHRLKDIGIDRSQIARVADRLAQSPPAAAARPRHGRGPARSKWGGTAACRQP
jgi:uncharacterized protein YjiS (DUF1127 family)